MDFSTRLEMQFATSVGKRSRITAQAASMVKPPAKTASRCSSSRSPSDSSA
jgi:hypothetical protein